MKKRTIASFALTLSATNAMALIGPPRGGSEFRAIPEVRKVCLALIEEEDGLLRARDCDSSLKNRLDEVPLLANGCAENQVAIETTRMEIRTCPMAVQL